MSSKLSVEEVLARLEARVAFHREQEAFHRVQEGFHAQQVVHHREQQALHGSELEKAAHDLETFRTVAGSAMSEPVPAPAAVELPPANRWQVGRLVKLALESADLQEPFGPAAVAAETNRRFAGHLSKPVGPRTASDVLRRMLADRQIQLARKGTAKREALYKRMPPR
jgi:hypothetical protein